MVRACDRTFLRLLVSLMGAIWRCRNTVPSTVLVPGRLLTVHSSVESLALHVGGSRLGLVFEPLVKSIIQAILTFRVFHTSNVFLPGELDTLMQSMIRALTLQERYLLVVACTFLVSFCVFYLILGDSSQKIHITTLC